MPLFLRQWRHRRGWSLTDLAERSGIARPNLSNLERGAGGKGGPTLATIERLAKALRIKPGELLAPPPPDNDQTGAKAPRRT